MKSRSSVRVLLSAALLSGCAGSVPRTVDGIPVTTGDEAHKAKQKWFEERARESVRQVTYRVRNERPGEGWGPDVSIFDYTYYLQRDSGIAAVAFRDTSGKLLAGVPARSIVPFDATRFTKESAIRRFFEAKRQAPDSLELVWPALAPDNIPLPAWRIVSDGEVWYLYCELDMLMSVAEVKQQVAGGLRHVEPPKP